ncbi:hypothetical protein [Actinomadura bangladeshensis]|uniref:hypothetical protein n=1 Tax=Actinomadura bangladeshensis TaxID=453573 RepID=UPI0019459C45|nr:hypothetical protein [Actinomadura bangladeshensis]
MTRLRHARALVRHAHAFAARAFGDRIPSPHGPAFRLTGAVTALAVAATTFTPISAAADTREARLTSAHPSTSSARMTPLRPGRADRPLSAGARFRAGHLTPPAQTPRPVFADPSTSATPTESAPFTPAQEPSSAASPLTRPPMPSDSESAVPVEETLPKLPDLPVSLRLEQRFAETALRGSGIRWRSTGGCSDRTVRTCTSFKGVRWGTIKGVIDFAESSGCKITITGGTERGHAPGTYSHANGYKLDIAPGRCVDAAIKRYPSAGTRGDGARLYRSPDGTVFAREKDHWDITFR